MSANNNNRVRSINSIETHGYETNKDFIFEKEKTKYKNIIKQCRKWWTLMFSPKKT